MFSLYPSVAEMYGRYGELVECQNCLVQLWLSLKCCIQHILTCSAYYNCVWWLFFYLGENITLQVFENKVLERYLGLRRTSSRILEEFHDLYFITFKNPASYI